MNLLQHLIRPDDLLNLWIETDNLRLDPEPGDGAAASTDNPGLAPALVVDDPQRPGLLTVIFPPQHIAEEAVFETPSFTGDPDPNRPAPGKIPSLPDTPQPRPAPGHFKARIAQSSRLVFEVPNGHRIPYTIEGLLDWGGLVPRLHPIAAIGEQATAAERAAAPALSAPDAHQTVLELPYALLISPGTTGVWQHRLTPATHAGRSELWHTRLALRGSDGKITELDADHTAPLRALWSTDPIHPIDTQHDISQTAPIGRTALAPDDRRQLVILTSAFHGYETNPDRAPKAFAVLDLATGHLRNLRPWRLTPEPYLPLPFHARQLMLSPLGGWLKSRGMWEPPRLAKPSRRLEAIGVLHDHHWADVLAPVGRRAAAPLLRADKVSDRLLEMFVPAAPVASDGQLDLSEWVHVATQGRDHYVRVVYEGELWPFRHRAALVKITEREFRLDSASGLVVACLVQRMFIVVREPEKTLDRRDNPFTRVRLTTLITPDLAEPLVNKPPFHRTFWVEVGPGAQRQKFHFHAVGTDQADRTVDFTIPLVFASITDVDQRPADVAGLYNADAQRGADALGHKIAYTPLRSTENALLASQTLLFDAHASGASPALHSAAVHISQLEDLLGNSAPAEIAYDDTYTSKGYDAANRTGVFAKLITPQPVIFRADQAGGIATPNQTITALSDQQGPVAGDVAKARADEFDPTAYFPKGAPRLFGTFDLLDLLLSAGGLSQQVPMLRSERTGNSLVTTLHWQPAIQKVPHIDNTDAPARFLPKPGAALTIDSRVERPLAGASAPRSEFKGSLTDFDIEILSSVTLHFDRFGLTSVNGVKPDVIVELDGNNPLTFTGDLQFVEDLRKAIPPGLFGKGASIELTGVGVRAGFAIALPPLEIGVFALKDVSLGAALTLPFLDGKPLFDFNVSERANPFQLRVAFFAGGGFFHLQLDTAGMRQLEAALEFGAAFGLNLGVASGEVHAMAGIYFAIQRESNGTELCRLTGYLRLGGRLSVLGLIRISIEFNLSFTYDDGTHKAYGRATLTVQVEVLFFSVSVDLTVERAFGGSGDPLFLQTFDTAQRWQDYTSAFA